MTNPNPSTINVLKALENNIDSALDEKLVVLKSKAKAFFDAAEDYKKHLVLQLISEAFNPKVEKTPDAMETS